MILRRVRFCHQARIIACHAKLSGLYCYRLQHALFSKIEENVIRWIAQTFFCDSDTVLVFTSRASKIPQTFESRLGSDQLRSPGIDPRIADKAIPITHLDRSIANDRARRMSFENLIRYGAYHRPVGHKR